MSINKQSATIRFPSSNQQIIIPTKFSNEGDENKDHPILSKIHHRKTRTQAIQQSQFHRIMQSKAKQLLLAQSQANTSFQPSQFQFAGYRYSNKNNLIHYHRDQEISAFKSVEPCYQSINNNISSSQLQQEKVFRYKQKIKLQPTVQQQAYWNKRNHHHPVFRPAVLNPTFSIPLSKQETRLIMMNQNKHHHQEGTNLDKFNDAIKQFALRTQGLCMSNDNSQQQSYMERKRRKISMLSKKVIKARCKSLNSIQQQYQKQHALSDIQKHQTRCLLNLRIKKLESIKKIDNDRQEETNHFMKHRQNTNQYPIQVLGLSDEEETSKSMIRLRSKSKSCAIGQFGRCQNKKLAVMKILSKMARAKVEQNSAKKKQVPLVRQGRPSDFLRSIKLKINQCSKNLSQQKDKNINYKVRQQIDKTVKQFCTKMKTENLVVCSLMKNNVSSNAKQFLPNS